MRGGHHPRIDLVGRRFGFLTVVGQNRSDKISVYWNCICYCGASLVRRGGDLLRRERNGSIQSCGCRRRRTNDGKEFKCGRCGEIKAKSEFYVDPGNSLGIHGHCKACNKNWREHNRELLARFSAEYRAENSVRVAKALREYRRKNRHIGAERESRRRALIRQATPLWADINAIRDIYELAQEFRDSGVDVAVDHIVPLKGKTVTGLHVQNNLRIILSSHNNKKSNRVWPDMP